MKNRLDTQTINVIYCQPGEILAYFYTKTIQGSLFRKFRDVVIGIRYIISLKREIILADQERVDDNGTSGLNKTVKTEVNKTVTIDGSRFTNMVKINSNVSRK